MLYPPKAAPSSGPALSRSWLRRVALSGIKAALPGSDGIQHRPIQMGLVIADDETLKRLNRDYRGSDEVTDVLSFSWEHQGHWEGDDALPDEAGPDDTWPTALSGMEDRHPLGEVIVSYPQAERQAQARGASTEQELALLIVHGILHLTGYDHIEPDQEAQMKAKEAEALSRIWSNR